ncbi:MAG: trypsin-like peptidase domain-containing protein [Candidatus Eremiobacteraeota bacterium]|nr:trypsin-like peptidase domain-containing protein [Candidatus Eremiobacteraeota bacterium]
MQKMRIVPTLIVGLAGAVIGSFSMMLYASTHFAGIAGPGNTPPAVAAAPLSGSSDQERIIGAVKRVAPSVVALNVSVNGQQMIPQDPFSQFFGQPGSPQRVQRFKARASGSGFVYSRSGTSAVIVTNAHVVRPPNGASVSDIQVVFQNGEHVPGHVYAANVGSDLALVKVDGVKEVPPPVEIADSSKVQSGQWAIAIGEPFELKQSVSLGVVSGFNRDETIGTENGGGQISFKGLLQTSAPINPGNSGGPLIDVEGRLIGVNQSTANPQAGAQGIGFAIPASTVREQVAALEKSPGVHQGTNAGFIGAGLATVTPDLGVQLNYRGKGVAVAQVLGGGPADQAGLQAGDVIQKVNGTDVTTDAAVVKAIRATKPGGTINMQVWSGGVKKLVIVKVQERPAETSQLQAPDPNAQEPNQQP